MTGPENEFVGELSVSGSTFTWKIKKFSKLNAEKIYSETFAIGDYKWRLLVFPTGNDVDHLSLYLEVADSQCLPDGWSKFLSFTLTLVNQLKEDLSEWEATEHKFRAEESDWGFTEFLPLGELYGNAGFLVKDTCIVKVEINIEKAKSEVVEVVKKEEYKTIKDQESGSRKRGKLCDEKRQEKSHDEETEGEAGGKKKKLERKEAVEENDKDPLEAKIEEMGGEESREEAGEREKEKPNDGNNIETEMGRNSGIKSESGNPNLSESGTVTISCPSQSLQALSLVECQSQLEKFAALFAEIAVVAGKTATNPDEVEISKSMSLLKEVSTQPFSEIFSNLRAEVTAAVKVLVQAKTIPSGQASMFRIILHEFEDIFKSYGSSIAAFETTQRFFDSKDSIFDALNRLRQSHLKIQNAIHDIEREKEQLERRLRELAESESRLLEEYGAVGVEAQRAMVEWDSLILKDAGILEQRRKAQKEKARAERMWTDLVSVFK